MKLRLVVRQWLAIVVTRNARLSTDETPQPFYDFAFFALNSAHLFPVASLIRFRAAGLILRSFGAVLLCTFTVGIGPLRPVNGIRIVIYTYIEK